MNPLPELTFESLLAHEGFLRRVVVELVDEHEAEDILQETWAAALSTGLFRLRSPRAWLRRVAENLAVRRRRTAVRQRQREASVAREEALPATETLVSRLHAHQRVAQAVTDLEEPYRTVVLLRFFEDLPPREIATRLGVNGSTVRTRLERGIERLRGHLEREDDALDVRALAVSILMPRTGESVAMTSGGASIFAMGALIMFARYQVAAAALLLSVLGYSLWVVASAPPVEVVEASAERAAAAPDPGGETQPAEVDTGRAQAAPTRAPVVESEPAPVPEAPPAAIRGRVIDSRGQPVANVPLVFEKLTKVNVVGSLGVPGPTAAAQPVGDSRKDGTFTFPTEVADLRIFATGDYVTIRTFTPARADRGRETALIVVARRHTVRGRAVNWLGFPVGGVSVVARIDGLVDMNVPIGHANQVELPKAVTDRLGRFTLEGLPHIPELALQCTKSGYKAERRHGLAANESVKITMRSHRAGSYRVLGTVVDATGALVEGATVFLHQTMVQTGKYGEFAIESEQLAEESLFLAGVPGREIDDQSALVKELLAARQAATPGSAIRREGVVFRLGGAARVLQARVVDHSGAPVPDWIVTLFDARSVEAIHTVEDFVAGKRSRLESIGKATAKIDARTDANGEFSLRGLSRRAYRLRLFDGATLAGITVPVDAEQTRLTVRLPEMTRRTIRGTVTNSRGEGLPGITVTWGLETLKCGGFSMFGPGANTKTDDRGRFEFAGVPTGDARLNLSGRGIIDHEHSLRGVASGADLRITTLTCCRFRFEAPSAARGEVVVLGPDDEPLELKRRQGQMAFSGMKWRVRGGRTPILEVSEAARRLVFRREGQPEIRKDVRFRGTGVEVVRVR